MRKKYILINSKLPKLDDQFGLHYNGSRELLGKSMDIRSNHYYFFRQNWLNLSWWSSNRGRFVLVQSKDDIILPGFIYNMVHHLAGYVLHRLFSLFGTFRTGCNMSTNLASN